MICHCFAYGSLMCEDIMAAVCGVAVAALSGRPAQLAGFARHPVLGESYPGMVPAPAQSVAGIVYLDLPATVWARLDAFEGEMYERQPVSVALGDGQILIVQTYVFRPEFAHCLAHGEWDFEAFLKEGKGHFITRYLGYTRL
jgi:gamma-glutamylcyclotransferase (GGCT)/AIG2-like uncharacterized protein YtfP